MQHQKRLPIRAFIPFTILFFSFLFIYTPEVEMDSIMATGSTSPTLTATPSFTSTLLPTNTATITPTPTPTPTSTSIPGPPILIAPSDGAYLPQPVPPGEWNFSWDARTGPCYCIITINGPGRHISTYVNYGFGYPPYQFHYTGDFIPDDALSPWFWYVEIWCPLGQNISELRTFSVLPGSSPTPTLTSTPTERPTEIPPPTQSPLPRNTLTPTPESVLLYIYLPLVKQNLYNLE